MSRYIPPVRGVDRTGYRKGYRPIVGYTFAVALSAALSGCASLGLTGNPVADLPAIQADVVKGCQVYAKVAAPLAVAPDPTLQAYVAFGGGLCDIATGNVLATAVPNIDKNTGLWITAITGAIQAASTAVPVAAAPAAAPVKP